MFAYIRIFQYSSVNKGNVFAKNVKVWLAFATYLQEAALLKIDALDAEAAN